uniref:Uncharacterized protein n=1 Tax=Heterorhabditis bacteriophora TaxID=37862 RepID=A0A1I7WLQ8_HETBA
MTKKRRFGIQVILKNTYLALFISKFYYSNKSCIVFYCFKYQFYSNVIVHTLILPINSLRTSDPLLSCFYKINNCIFHVRYANEVNTVDNPNIQALGNLNDNFSCLKKINFLYSALKSGVGICSWNKYNYKRTNSILDRNSWLPEDRKRAIHQLFIKQLSIDRLFVSKFCFLFLFVLFLT